MQTNVMQAAVLSRYGAPENIELKTINRPTPKPNEVLIKVYATPVTAADTMMRRGQPVLSRLFLGFSRPRNNIMGTCFAGKVVQVGNDVEAYRVGDRVFGESGLSFATNAEYLCVAEDSAMDLIPTNLSYEKAAPLCDGSLTSFHFLKTLGRVQPGQSVLIIGASGSLGTAAVQLAKTFGARVTGVCSGRNLELVHSLGADSVIDYTQTDFTQTEATYDVVFDTLGISSWANCRQLLGVNGRYLSPVLKVSTLWEMFKTRFFSKQQVKFDATGLRSPQVLRAYLEELVQLIEERKFNVIIDKTYPLAEAVAAHRYVDSGRKRGNIVLLTTTRI